MATDEPWTTIERERLRLADLLGELRPEQWNAASWCEGWRVREVVAHVTMSTRIRPLDALVGVVRARGNFNAFVDADARSRAERPTNELIAELRASAASRHHPIGTKPEDPLVDVVVHAQDVARPLGLDHPMPLGAATVAAARVWGMTFPFHARRRLAGVRLRAVDTEWERGPAAGPEAAGTMADLLLLLTGRPVPADRMTGEGAARIRATVG